MNSTHHVQREWPESVGQADWDQVAPKLRAALKRAILGQHWPIYLFGNAGRGKSCAVACVYMRCLGSALWFDAHQVVSDVLACRTSPDRHISRTAGDVSYEMTETSIRGKVKDASLVVFDDVGMRRPTEAGFEVFLGLINLRRGKATIYTGNLGGPELASVYDARIASRLLSGTVIELTGSDRRAARRVVERVDG